MPKGLKEWAAVAVVEHNTLFLAVMGPKGLGFPGGKPEGNETHFACAKRECEEETGFVLEFENFIAGVVADSPVMTYAYYQHVQAPDMLKVRDSKEGVACWVPAKALIGEHARFPKYNRNVLKRCGIQIAKKLAPLEV